jgi:hypothetical protein
MDTKTKWYLGFDCATKTFAFSLSHIDLDTYNIHATRIRSQLANATELLKKSTPETIDSIYQSVSKLDIETKEYINIVDGETVDLFPSRSDASISTVERIRAVSRYINSRIIPSIQRLVPVGEKLMVVVEFQMGQNVRARAVASAILTLFCEEEIIIVGPSLKNKVSTCEAGRYCYFAEKYTTSYSANKAHTKYNFANIERLFGSGILNMSDTKKGHIADSFIQVLGHLIFGKADSLTNLQF